MANDTTNYTMEASSDAADMAENFIDEIIEAICEVGAASADVRNDYPGGDSYHHETHVDKSYNLQEAAKLLDDLDDYEETDNGLWEGSTPRDAIGAQAAYTYGNAVLSMFSDLIDSVNSDDDIEELRGELLESDDDPEPAPQGIDGWNVDQCREWLEGHDIDPDSLELADDDVFGWREQVAGVSHSLQLPRRARAAIKADIKARVEEIIAEER